jgi:hypothetical protein
MIYENSSAFDLGPVDDCMADQGRRERALLSSSARFAGRNMATHASANKSTPRIAKASDSSINYAGVAKSTMIAFCVLILSSARHVDCSRGKRASSSSFA